MAKPHIRWSTYYGQWECEGADAPWYARLVMLGSWARELGKTPALAYNNWARAIRRGGSPMGNYH